MKIAGFNLTKLSIEKSANNLENLKLNMKIDISEIKKIDNNIIKSEDSFLSVSFVYSINYEPKIAEVTLTGNLLLALNSKLAKEIEKQWENKKMPEDFRHTLFNLIMRKTAVKAFQLEEEVGLPLHIPLPSLNKSKAETEKEE